MEQMHITYENAYNTFDEIQTSIENLDNSQAYQAVITNLHISIIHLTP